MPITLENFTIELIVIESSCFDSAGAHVTVQPEVTFTASFTPLPSDYRALLVFEVHGSETVETKNVEIEGSQYTFDSISISTASCDFELTAVPVRLIER